MYGEEWGVGFHKGCIGFVSAPPEVNSFFCVQSFAVRIMMWFGLEMALKSMVFTLL